MLRRVFPNEKRIKVWQDMAKSSGVRRCRSKPAAITVLSYGQTLRASMKKRRLTYRKLAELTGIKVSSLQSYSGGHGYPPPHREAVLLKAMPELSSYAQPKVKVKLVDGPELVGKSVQEAQHLRDEHIANLRQAIDYYLTAVAYEDIPCCGCRLPVDALEFAAAVLDFEEPANQCELCLGRKVIRSKKTDPQSGADAKLVGYWSTNLDDFIRCAKIKTGATDADEAYSELETANRFLLIKFGNERQTSLEGADAEQGVRHGLIDAAMRFDLLKQKNGKYCCATFNTVAYNWCRRNSRARHRGQKRAGVYAPSIESMGTDEDGNGMASLITSAEGALGTFDVPTSAPPSLVLDLREQVEALPELQRAVVEAELAELSTGETARRLEISTAKVRRLRELAFETLRETLGGYVSTLHD